jgi:hypothetical protein
MSGTGRIRPRGTQNNPGHPPVRFNSRSINLANPFVRNRTVPEGMRQQILDAISKATGRKASSAQ